MTDSFKAVEEAFSLYKDNIFNYVSKMIGCSFAVDITQDVFTKALEKWSSAKPRNVKAWIFRIAHNACIDHIRRSTLERRILGKSEKPKNSSDTILLIKHDSIKQPLDNVLKSEMYDNIMIAINKLPEEQKQVFLLREESGMNFKEIAAIVDAPLNTVLGRMHYAIQNLSKNLHMYKSET